MRRMSAEEPAEDETLADDFRFWPRGAGNIQMTGRFPLRKIDRRLLAVVIALSVAGYPLIAGLPVLLGLDSRAVTIPFRALLLGLSLWALWRRASRGLPVYRGFLWIPLILFCLFYGLRLTLAGAYGLEAPVIPIMEFVAFAVGMSLIPMLACFTIPDDLTHSLARSLTFFFAVVAALVALSLARYVSLAGQLQSLGVGRLSLETLNPISLGHLGVTIVLLALERLTELRRGMSWKAGALLAAAVLGLVTAGMAASRGPLLALAIGLIGVAIIARGRGRISRGVLLTVALVLAAVSGAGFLQERSGFSVVTRLENVRTDASTEIRLTVMRDAWDQFSEHPFLGSGIAERNSGSYPHNLPLEALMATGVIGGAAYLVLLIGGLRAAWSIMTRGGAAAWLGLLFVQYFVGGMVSGSIVASAPLYVLLAACVAAACTRPMPNGAANYAQAARQGGRSGKLGQRRRTAGTQFRLARR